MTRASQDIGQAQRHAGFANGFVPLKLLGLVLAGFLCFALDQAVSQEPGGSNTPRTIGSAEDIFTDWQPHQRLYVKGDLGVGDSQLAGLERWLDQNGTNWVVVLMDTAAGERFTDASGRSFRDMDAVEHRLGKGLPALTDFGAWTDPRTGDRSGAFFVLFLKERKFSYYGSDAYDKRSLGEDRWKGRLDQPAINAMRGGGRVIDAAKDTVSSIDKQLAQKIAAAERMVKQTLAKVAARKERLKAKAGGLYQNAQGNLARLQTEITDMRDAQPELKGAIVHLDFTTWYSQLVSAKSNLDREDYEAAVSVANEVLGEVARVQGDIEHYKNAPLILDGLESDLVRMQGRQYAGLVASEFSNTQKALADARRLHATADPLYYPKIDEARSKIRDIEQFIERKARQVREQRHLLIIAGSLTVLVLAILGLFLNRRRRPTRTKALELIDAWKHALDEKRGSASSLMHRSMESLGVSRLEAEVRFSGATLELVEQTIRDVDEMVIMANCASRVLQDARSLVRPDAPIPRIVNLFLKRRHLSAIRRLRDQPISFRPEEGLARVMTKKRTERDRLLGDLGSYKPFQLSFNELIDHFNERAGRALDSLNLLEKAQLDIADLLINVKLGIDETQSTAMDLDESGSEQEWFPISDVLVQLLPSATGDYSEAAVVSIKDPMGALRGVGKRSREQSSDARQLVQLSKDFETELFPKLGDVRSELVELNLAAGWIGKVLKKLSQEFGNSVVEAIRSDQSITIGRIESQASELLTTAIAIRDVENRRCEKIVTGIEQANHLVNNARGDLAKKLKLSSGRLLIEPGRNPDYHITVAGEQSSAARAAANRGDVRAANVAIDSALGELEEVHDLVEATKSAFVKHDGVLGLREAEQLRLQREIPVHESILETITTKYATSVLLLGVGDSSHPDANGTIRDNITEMAELMTRAGENIQSSIEWIASGRILDSAAALEQADADHQSVVFRLREIREKEERLIQFEKENRSLLELLLTRIGHLEALAKDKRTMTASQENVARVKRGSETFSEAIDAPRGDPFKLSEELNHLKGEIDNVEIVIHSDWREHKEVLRSIELTKDQIARLGKLETRSATDNFPDSLITREIIGEAKKLREELPGLQARSEQPHGDWDQLDDQVDELARRAGLLAARLRNDLEAAEKAHVELRSAMNSVRAASRWSGEYGVSLSSGYGTGTLTQARHGFQRGDYAAAVSAALLAKRMAIQAIALAEAEVNRRRQAEQQRIIREQQRRAAAARRAARSVSRSSFRSSSGSSRSSFSSGSGTSRSGW